MVGNDILQCTISFYRRPSSPNLRIKQPPKQFLCLISTSLMFVISSAHTSAHICRHLGFTPDGSIPNFNTLIHNLATILSRCNTVGLPHPPALDCYSFHCTVRSKMDSLNGRIRGSDDKHLPGKPPATHKHSATEMNIGNSVYSSSSEGSVIASVGESPSVPFTNRPSCFSGHSSISTSFGIISDEKTLISDSSCCISKEEEQILLKLKSFDVFDNNQGFINLRKITRTNEQIRVTLCTPPILTALRSALNSKYIGVQTNAAASIVNLSLEKVNKVKIVRSGLVPPLIAVLKGGFGESQEHAAGALFSLSMEDVNRTAIGVLGGLQPLLHALRSESERTWHDSALALYNLSLIQSNRVKLVKLGAVSTLLSLLENDDMLGRVLLVVCNLAACLKGRSMLLHFNAVQCLVGILRKVSGADSESTRENCVAALYSLSQRNMRFKNLAVEAGAAEVLKEVLEGKLSQLSKEKVEVILMILRGRKVGEEIDWELVMKRGPSQNVI